ncbi:hypothetical protein POTOM_029064 [Populus tomentosa]|uniref:Cupin type-1 domain-containing protein n=1 Tax=Populus tomentosa TaxID=118781 RepID=A0A8X8CSQ5_POPTO|nr:hypothetical protein POTOM_029064 [Populus tomentosa]
MHADIISDFVVSPNVTKVDGKLFTFTSLRSLVGAKPPTAFTASKVRMAEFPALNGQLGFVDTTNKLFTKILESGDMFVFSKGLVHCQYNNDPNNLAVAVSAFGSASSGTVSIPSTLFTTGIDSGILAKAFKTDVATIEKLKAGPDKVGFKLKSLAKRILQEPDCKRFITTTFILSLQKTVE